MVLTGVLQNFGQDKYYETEPANWNYISIHIFAYGQA